METTVESFAASNTFRAEYPEQDIPDLRLLGEGWDSIVYLINDALVLRFPKNLGAAGAIATEIRLLP